MWQAFMDWLPDLRMGALEARDVLGLIVAVIGAVLAYIAVKSARDQATLAREQGAIIKRQDRILRRHQSQSPRLVLYAKLNVAETDLTRPPERLEWWLYLANHGDKVARDVSWTVSLSFREDCPSVSALSRSADVTMTVEHSLVTGYLRNVFRGRWTLPLYPTDYLQCASIITPIGRYDTRPRECYYVLECTDGRFPPVGAEAKLDLPTLSYEVDPVVHNLSTDR